MGRHKKIENRQDSLMLIADCLFINAIYINEVLTKKLSTFKIISLILSLLGVFLGLYYYFYKFKDINLKPKQRNTYIFVSLLFAILFFIPSTFAFYYNKLNIVSLIIIYIAVIIHFGLAVSLIKQQK